MNKYAQAYSLLQRMVGYAEKADAESIRSLNTQFNAEVERYFHKLHTPIEVEYDNCRQSCLMSLQIPGLAKDAQKRFSMIPKPKK